MEDQAAMDSFNIVQTEGVVGLEKAGYTDPEIYDILHDPKNQGLVIANGDISSMLLAAGWESERYQKYLEAKSGASAGTIKALVGLYRNGKKADQGTEVKTQYTAEEKARLMARADTLIERLSKVKDPDQPKFRLGKKLLTTNQIIKEIRDGTDIGLQFLDLDELLEELTQNPAGTDEDLREGNVSTPRRIARAVGDMVEGWFRRVVS